MSKTSPLKEEQPENLPNNQSSISQIIQESSLFYLEHETSLESLKGILKEGSLKPRDKLDTKFLKAKSKTAASVVYMCGSNQRASKNGEKFLYNTELEFDNNYFKGKATLFFSTSLLNDLDFYCNPSINFGKKTDTTAFKKDVDKVTQILTYIYEDPYNASTKFLPRNNGTQDTFEVCVSDQVDLKKYLLGIKFADYNNPYDELPEDLSEEECQIFEEYSHLFLDNSKFYPKLADFNVQNSEQGKDESQPDTPEVEHISLECEENNPGLLGAEMGSIEHQ